MLPCLVEIRPCMHENTIETFFTDSMCLWVLPSDFILFSLCGFLLRVFLPVAPSPFVKELLGQIFVLEVVGMEVVLAPDSIIPKLPSIGCVHAFIDCQSHPGC